MASRGVPILRGAPHAAEIEPDEWSTTNPIAIGVRAGAAAALGQAQKAVHVVYLAVHGSQAKDYRRVRGWVEIKGAGSEALPRGPVLGRLAFASGAHDNARRALFADLRERFDGPMAAVVRTAEALKQLIAEICHRPDTDVSRLLELIKEGPESGSRKRRTGSLKDVRAERIRL